MKANKFVLVFFALLIASGSVYAQSPTGGSDDKPYGSSLDEPQRPDRGIPIIRSKAPNDIQGSEAVGPIRLVSSKEIIAYTIRFENDAQFADPSAQRVVIRCPIHPKPDIKSV